MLFHPSAPVEPVHYGRQPFHAPNRYRAPGKNVGASPGKKGRPAAICPQLGSHCRPVGSRTRVKAVGVNRDQRVRGNAEARRRRKAELLQFLGRNSQRPSLRKPVSVEHDVAAPAMLPRCPLRRQFVRACDIGERAPVVRHVGKEQPRLERRMECVRVQLQLRVRRAVSDPACDRLKYSRAARCGCSQRRPAFLSSRCCRSALPAAGTGAAPPVQMVCGA
jgi:hypothetical protein